MIVWIGHLCTYNTFLFIFKYKGPNLGLTCLFHLIHMNDSRYSVSDLEEKKKYIVNMEITVCLELSGACIFTWNILKNVYLHKLGCDWNEDFSGKFHNVNII